MSRVLAYCSPARGHLFPLVSVLVELRARGHEVALRCPGGEVGAMRGLGFKAAAIADAVEALPMDDWQARTPPGRAVRAVRVLGERARHDAPDLLAAVADERPQALLVDVLSLGALSAAEAWGGPWACFAPYPLPLAAPGVPPAGPGWAPARGVAGRLRDRLVQPLFAAAHDRVVLPRLNSLRCGLGLPAFASAEDMYLAPPLLLYMTAEPFEYPRRDWPRSFVLVGPCIWEPAAAPVSELIGDKGPLVLVTASTEFQDDGRLLSTAVEALADAPVHVVVTAAAARPGQLSRAANATVLEFAPHTPLLARAACAVTHGGMGVTQKALAHGVPVCAVPFGRDQYEVARRVVVAGAGTVLPAPLLHPALLRRKVVAAARRRGGAERIAAAFARAGGAVAAADAFERSLGAAASRPPS